MARTAAAASDESVPLRRNPTAGGFFKDYFVAPFVSSRNPPWFDARGVAVGLAVGFGAPLGTQMILLGLLRALFRFNSVTAFAFTWVNNPISILPLYYGYYYLGSLMLGKPPVMSPDDFRELLTPILHANCFWQGLLTFMHLGWDVVVSWSLTAAILAVVTGTLGYLVALHAQRARSMRRARELGVTYEQLLTSLERRRTSSTAPD
jgi:uncharacterized protein